MAAVWLSNAYVAGTFFETIGRYADVRFVCLHNTLEIIIVFTTLSIMELLTKLDRLI